VQQLRQKHLDFLEGEIGLTPLLTDTAVPGNEHILTVNQGKSQWNPHTPIPKLSLDDSHGKALRTSIEEDAANAMPD
jgi:hypothetical protein